MKLKLQQGGTFVPPFAVYQPFAIPDASDSKSSSKSNESEADLKFKDVLTLLNDLDGLPGDVQHAAQTLTTLFNSIHSKLNSPQSSLFGGTSSIASNYMKAVQLINNIKFQASEYEKAKEQAVENNSINEVVINSMGKVMVATDDGFDWVTPEECFENSDRYMPVTNAQLLNYRAMGTGKLAFNHDAINAVAGSISYDQVTDMISKAVQNLGNDAQSQDIFVKTKAGKLIQGLQDFIKAKENSGSYDATVEDLYQANLLTESQARQAKQALGYIYNCLPKSAVSLLKMKSDGTAKGAQMLIDVLVYSKNKEKTDLKDLKLISGPSKDIADAGGIAHNFVLDVQAGHSGVQGSFTLNNASGTKMSSNAVVYEGIKNLSGGYVQKTSLRDALEKSGLIQIVKGDVGVFFGDQRLDPSQLEDITYDGTGLVRVELPVDSNGKPRFDLLELAESYNIEIQIEPEKAKTIANKEKYKDLKPYLTQEGRFNKKLFAPFLLINGISTRDLIGVKDENKFVVNKGSDDNLYSTIMHTLSEANVSNKEKYLNLDTKNWWELWESAYDPIYKATVFIPISMSKQAALLGSNTSYKGSKYELEYQLSNANYSNSNTDIKLLND